MIKRYLSISHVSQLLADTWSPDYNLDEQLLDVSHAEYRKARERLCMILSVQFGHHQKTADGSFYHDCYSHGHGDLKYFDGALDRSAFPLLILPLEIRLEVYHYALVGKYREVECESLNFDAQYEDFQYEHGSTVTILRVNRQVFHEAEPILYQSRSFDFAYKPQRGLDFLQGISKRARLSIRCINMDFGFHPVLVKNDNWNIPPYYEEWDAACAYISDNLSIKELSFDCYSAAVPADFRNVHWVNGLVRIRGLKKLSQKPRHLPLMRHYVDNCSGYDHSPDKVTQARMSGLLKYLRSEMLEAGAARTESIAWDFNDHCGPF